MFLCKIKKKMTIYLQYYTKTEKKCVNISKSHLKQHIFSNYYIKFNLAKLRSTNIYMYIYMLIFVYSFVYVHIFKNMFTIQFVKPTIINMLI